MRKLIKKGEVRNPTGKGGQKKNSKSRNQGSKWLAPGWIARGVEDKVIRMGGSAKYMDWVKREHPQEFIRYVGKLMEADLKRELVDNILAVPDNELEKRLVAAAQALPEAVMDVLLRGMLQAQQQALPEAEEGTVISVDTPSEQGNDR